MIVVNYKGLIVGAPLFPVEVMGFVLVVAKIMAYCVYETL